ncbi:MAG: hypothetical protein AB8B92_07970 [Gammaproteobacteria bacterium]
MSEEKFIFINALINIAVRKLLPVTGGVDVNNKESQAKSSADNADALSYKDNCAVTGVQFANLRIQAKKYSHLRLG